MVGPMVKDTPAVIFGLPLLAYLLGSIPWGLVLTRCFTSIDIRRQGSGNIGATNVRRLAGTPLHRYVPCRVEKLEEA